MRILVESYAARPDSSSEEARGWEYPLRFAGLGHDVTVVTSALEREAIEEALRAEPVPRLEFAYVPRRRWPLRLGWTVGSALQYVLWLWEAAAVARRMHAAAPFDVVQHAGYGTLLGGTFLWTLGCPLVFGPVGGGQTTPSAFLGLFGPYRRSEMVRTLVVKHLWRWIPHARLAVRRAAIVPASNEETLLLARRMGAGRARLFQDGALPAGMASPELPVREQHDGLRVLWVGRIMPRKAVELAVLAVEGLPEDAGVTLQVVGGGANQDMDARFRRWVSAHSAGGRVVAPGPVPFAQVSGSYTAADVLLFTSVRDTIGVQVVEAMAHGLPIVCLDHQGVHTLVQPDRGIRVPVTDVPGTARALGEALLELAADPARRVAMERAGHAWARAATWDHHARGLLALMDEAVARGGASRDYARAHDVDLYIGTNAGYTDREGDFTRERYRQFARRLPQAARRVLDVGCATGRGGEELLRARPGILVDGVDVLEERVEQAKERGYTRVHRASATDLPAADGVYDAVVSGELIEHLEDADVDRALREMRRVLRPGGVLMLTTPNPDGMLWRLRRRSTLNASHLSAHSRRSLRRRLERSGFTAVRFAGSGRVSRYAGERFPLLAVYGSYLIGGVRRG